jgi:OFA family oxalate/formate antiporter-like MFS transporter
MGFGAGSLIFAPLLESLIGFEKLNASGLTGDAYNAVLTGNIKKTFVVMAIIFYICVIGAAQVYRVPPAGWLPAGWTPPAVAAGTKTEYGPGDMIKTWQFYVLWLIYFFGSATGQVAIGQGKPIVGKAIINAQAAKSFYMSGGWTLGIMSAFNGAGRIFWGTLSDKIGRNMTTVAMYALYIVTCVFIVKPGVINESYTPILVGLCFIGFAYGGYLAMMPSFTADYYGAKNIGANYGIMFTAWGTSALVFTQVFAGWIKAAKAVGTSEALNAGYAKVYFALAALSAIGLVMAVIVRAPQSAAAAPAAPSMGGDDD